MIKKFKLYIYENHMDDLDPYDEEIWIEPDLSEINPKDLITVVYITPYHENNYFHVCEIEDINNDDDVYYELTDISNEISYTVGAETLVKLMNDDIAYDDDIAVLIINIKTEKHLINEIEKYYKFSYDIVKDYYKDMIKYYKHIKNEIIKGRAHNDLEDIEDEIKNLTKKLKNMKYNPNELLNKLKKYNLR